MFFKLFYTLLLINTLSAAVDQVLIPDNTLVVQDQYIIKVNHASYSKHIEIIKSYNLTLLREFDNIKGYSCKIDLSTLNKIKKMKEVISIETDTFIKLNEFQEDAPYHLSRLTSGIKFKGNEPYKYDSEGGKGVTAYIIDSGIDIYHNEFGNRAYWGTNLLRDTKDIDAVGHGTHVAGIIGSETYGVAKAVKLVAVKVFDPSIKSANSDVIAAIDWIIRHHNSGEAIINLSLSSSYSSTLNNAVESAISRGFSVVVAAGNSNSDSCNASPSSADGVITVGATTRSDTRASYSNYGRCLTIFAPGDEIISTWSDGSTKRLSGTSMASPFITGLSALILSKNSLSPYDLSRTLTSMALKGVIKNPGSDSPNLLAHYEN